MFRRLCAAFVLVVAAAPLCAQKAAGKATLALVGGQIVDGYEGAPVQDGVVLIAGDRDPGSGAALRGRRAARDAGHRHAGHDRDAGAGGHARAFDDPGARRLRALGQDLPRALPQGDHARRREAALAERHHVRAGPGRAARRLDRRSGTGSRRARSRGRASTFRARFFNMPTTTRTRRSGAGRFRAPRTRARRRRRSSTLEWTSSS